MNSYQPSLPRAVLGSIAFAMAAITISAMAVLPATLGPAGPARLTLVEAATATATPIEVTINPARINVTAVREPDVAWALTDAARPNCKPEG